jgi:hypothetical protein
VDPTGSASLTIHEIAANPAWCLCSILRSSKEARAIDHHGSHSGADHASTPAQDTFCRSRHALAPVLRLVAVSDGLDRRGVTPACIVSGSCASFTTRPCTGVMCGCCSGALWHRVGAGSSCATREHLAGCIACAPRERSYSIVKTQESFLSYLFSQPFCSWVGSLAKGAVERWDGPRGWR